MRRLTLPSISIRSSAIALCVWLAAVAVEAQPPAGAKRPITHDDYDQWRTVHGTRISRDGSWLVYSLLPQRGDGELVAHNLRTGEAHRYARGRSPAITADGRFVVFTIAPPAPTRGESGRSEGPGGRRALAILELSTGALTRIDGIRSFTLAQDASRFVAYLRAADGEGDPAQEDEEGRGHAGAEPGRGGGAGGAQLVIRELATGRETSIADVREYVWSPDGAWLAYAVSSAAAGRTGAFVWRARDGSVRTLLRGVRTAKGLTFDHRGRQLAFVAGRGEAGPSSFRLYYWTPNSRRASELAPGATSGFPEGLAVSEHGRLQFSPDDSRLFFGTAVPPAPDAPPRAASPVRVDIWHWQDAELQPMQKARADEERTRSYRAVVHLRDRRVVQLASPEMPAVALSGAAGHALGISNLPYRQLISWDGRYDDVYLVNLEDGSRQQILEKTYFGASLSPGGQYALYFDDRDGAWHAQRVSDGRRVNLTGDLPVSFRSETWDTPSPPRPYGVGGWTADDRSVLLYDRYDIWEVPADGGGARMITGGAGRESRLVFRYRALDDGRVVPSGTPLLLHAVDERTLATGYYESRLDEAGAPTRLIMRDQAFGSLLKARDADVLVFTLSRFDEFPDLWVSDGRFQGLRRVSDANPQQASYAWGRAELMDFVNADGRPLRAILITPDDFDPSRTYPLMVHIYERLTPNLHRYVAPAPGTSLNATRYVSNGYVVLMPDIVYDVGHPGPSAEKCVIPAVQQLLSRGFIDPDRIGIQGHSWGGYQVAHLITRTSLFRAAQAGAPVTNMISAYGGIRWGSGMSRAFQYERTQSRIGGPPWTHTLQFIESSPIFWVERVRTPFLTLHNDGDEAVPWQQGIEFFNALRRLGKEAYLFNYNGERHALRARENLRHWTAHMAEFFDHHLQGAPRPAWMEEGVPYRGRR